MIRLQLRPPLTGIVGVQEIAVKLHQGTLRQVLEAASGEYPTFKAAVYDADGSFSADYTCILNSESINLRDDLDTVVDEDDDILILMPLAGG